MKRILFALTLFCFSFLAKAQIMDDVLFKHFGGEGNEAYTDLVTAHKDFKKVFKLHLNGLPDEKHKNYLKDLVYLQALALTNNGYTTLPQEIFKFHGLMYLYSKGNNLTNLGTGFEGLSNLTYLKLFDTKLDSLPIEIAYLSKLQLLHIQHNTAPLLKLTKEIRYLGSLQDLLIHNSNLDSLPGSIGKLSALTQISITKCGVSYIPNEIKGLKKLNYLVLDDNKLNEIPSSFFQLTNLEYLSLKNNGITKISEDIANLQKLRTLDLRGNSIDKENLMIVQALLSHCKIITE